MERGGGDEAEGGEISRIQPGHCVVWIVAGHVVGGDGSEAAAEVDNAGSSGAGKDREGNSGLSMTDLTVTVLPAESPAPTLSGR